MNLSKIRRIAVIRNAHIGDVIVALPLFEALRRGLPHAKITAVVNEQIAPILNNHPHVDDVLFDDYLGPAQHLTDVLRSGRFDAVLVAMCTPRNCWAALRAGIPIRVTECRAWKPALCGTHRVYWPPKWRDHVSTYLLSFAQRLGIAFTLEEARPYLYVDPLDRARIQKRIVGSLGDRGPLFATQPGSRGTSLNWPIENYFQLIERLSTVGRVLVTGSVFDRERLDWILGRLTPALRERVMLMTDLTLSELVAALALVDSFVSSSTGPLHIASIVSRSALGLYSDLFDQHPRRWRPIGQSGSYLFAYWNFPKVDLSPELVQRHMSQITVEMVADRMLQSASVVGEAARIA